jgi:restriction system protein
MILDYSEYSSQNYSYGLNSGPKKTEDESMFYYKREYCVFCKKKTEQIYNKPWVDTETIPGVAWHKINSVHICDCGWWEHTFYGYLEGEEKGFKDWTYEIDSAIIKKYNIESKDIPIKALNKYLSKNYDDIFKIHHKKLEELVGDVLSEHFLCVAHVVGQANDGGADVILIEAEEPIIVQVKRRTKSGKVESANLIRELIGATLLKESQQCIFVTTADHFSKQAVETKDDFLKKKIVKRFDLIDYHKFFSILNLTKSISDKPWQKLIER